MKRVTKIKCPFCGRFRMCAPDCTLSACCRQCHGQGYMDATGKSCTRCKGSGLPTNYERQAAVGKG